MDDGHFKRQRYLCPAPERAEEEEDREKWRVGRGEWEGQGRFFSENSAEICRR
jgi:hypothetical protein